MTTDTLSHEQFQKLIDQVKIIVARHADRYIADDAKAAKIQILMVEVVVNTSFYEFVLEQPMAALITRIASDRDTMDFVLSVTTAVSTYVATSDYGHDRLIRTLTIGFEAAQSRPMELSLLPQTIRNTVYLQEGWVFNYLQENFWLVVLYLYSLSNIKG